MAYLLVLTFFLAPTYVLRFSLFGLPTNALMVWIFVVWIIVGLWLISTRQVSAFFRSIVSGNKKFLPAVGIFFASGVIALAIGGINQPKLGQFLVWFVQPLSIFFLARFIIQRQPGARPNIIAAFYAFLFVSGVYAAIQYFTLFGLPPAWWGNSQEPKRALSFFAHPNDYALFIAPLLAFLVPDAMRRAAAWRDKNNLIVVLAWLVGGAGLLLSLSRGGWLGLAAAIAIYLLVYGLRAHGRWILAIIAVGIITVAAIPSLRWRVLLPFYGERSASARVVLWQTGWRMIKDSPVLGKGLLGSSNNWDRYAVDPSLGHYPFPHNIFFDAWIDLGLLGLLSFAALCGYGIWYGIKNRSNALALGLALFFIALLVHGQIDNPYFKNDLALVFWLVWAMVI